MLEKIMYILNFGNADLEASVSSAFLKPLAQVFQKLEISCISSLTIGHIVYSLVNSVSTELQNILD